MDRRIIGFAFIFPLILLAGCTNTQTKSSSMLMSSFRCTLPSQPGVIDVEVTGFPSEIIASTSDKEGSPVVFSIEFKNTITGVDYPEDRINIKYTFIPNIGKKYTKDVQIDLAYYDPTSNQITPSTIYEQVETKIPAGMSEMGVYRGVLRWEFIGKTKVYIPICIGYDPKITKVSPEVMVCDPTSLPEPCYSASPVIVNIESVKSIGAPRRGGSGIRGYYKIRFSLEDIYGGLDGCNGDYLSNTKRIKVDKIELKVDDLSIEEGGDIFRCYPLEKKDGKSYIYLRPSNEIVCYVYLDKLADKCKQNNNCYLDENSLKLGKSAMISIKLEYDYCRSMSLGPAKIVTLP